MSLVATPSHWPSLLRSACQRNAPIDLSPLESLTDTPILIERADQHFEATERPTWRVRMLALDREGIVVERPRIGGVIIAVAPGTMVEGVINDGTRRWAFVACVLEQVRQSLNGAQAVAGLRLSAPTQVREAQRRDYFRVGVAGVELPPVHMAVLLDCEAVPAYQKYNRLIHRLAGRTVANLVAPPEPPTGQTATATAIDVSGGGLCIAADEAIEPLLATLPHLWVRFHVPGAAGPIFTAARVAHWHREERRLVVGLCFDHDRDGEHGDFIGDIVCRFAAEQQRKQLKKR